MPQVPPFERFYLTHRDEVLGYLRRLLGPRAEDAWQEMLAAIVWPVAVCPPVVICISKRLGLGLRRELLGQLLGIGMTDVLLTEQLGQDMHR